MSATPVTSADTAASAIADQQARTFKATLVPALAAVAIGAVLRFGAGFAPMEALHNAAHDSRHSAGFPCH